MKAPGSPLSCRRVSVPGDSPRTSGILSHFPLLALEQLPGSEGSQVFQGRNPNILMDPSPGAALVPPRVVPLDGFDQSLMKSATGSSWLGQIWLLLGASSLSRGFPGSCSPLLTSSLASLIPAGLSRPAGGKGRSCGVIPSSHPISHTRWCQAEPSNPELLSLLALFIPLQEPGARCFPWMRWECAFPHFHEGAAPLILPP